jgi:ATP-dependent RNA helicase RhlE
MTQLTFGGLGLRPGICQALAARGIETPFPVQELVVPEVLSGRDLLVRSPTGSGKTLAFGLPLIERLADALRRPAPRALVLAPTRELAAQIAEELTAPAAGAGLKVACCYGGAALAAQASRAAKCDLLVATPGRLVDLVTRRMLSLGGIGILVLDEADRMLDMGFRPQVEQIVGMIPAVRQTLLFSATLDDAVADLASSLTSHPRRLRIGGEDVVTGVVHRFRAVSGADRVPVLVRELSDEPGVVLVFCRTKRGVDRLAERLTREGVDALPMHGDLTQAAREKALGRVRQGRCRVLVATDVAARGIDLDDVAMVVNFDAPEERDGYTHRVGRTARAGRGGRALTLVGAAEAGEVGRIAVSLGLEEEWAETGLPVDGARVRYATKRRGSAFAPPPAARPVRRPLVAPGEAPRANRVPRRKSGADAPQSSSPPAVAAAVEVAIEPPPPRGNRVPRGGRRVAA